MSNHMTRLYQATIFIMMGFCGVNQAAFAQDTHPKSGDLPKDLYRNAMRDYEAKQYPSAARNFQAFYEAKGDSATQGQLYNGACILALVKKSDQAFEVLDLATDRFFYSDLDHIRGDSDLETLHEDSRWIPLIERIKANKATQPRRTRSNVKSELLKAKAILEEDAGELWGLPIWSTDILVLDFDNTIYSLEKLLDCQTDDGILFYKTIEPNELAFTNSAQMYNGKRYAVVMVNYLDDNSATIIHELFHVVQLKVRKFRSDPVNYLDNHDARILLRLEFQALRNSLSAANGDNAEAAQRYLADAVTFRKVRQEKYASSRRDELEIETLEGMANYTGLKLSSIENKYLKAIDEIKGRESASTFTRPFPYATGPAYGLMFDYLSIKWRSEMETIYDFRDIFEGHNEEPLPTDVASIESARSRNNYPAIYAEETVRKVKHERNIEFYTRLLLSQPTLTASVTDGNGSYSMSFDMNGTLVLGDEGIVYSHIKGVDQTGNNFGSFHSIEGKDQLGVAGILRRKDGAYVFPFPTSVDGRKIVGETYEIELNEGWKVKKVGESGDLEIVRTGKTKTDPEGDTGSDRNDRRQE